MSMEEKYEGIWFSVEKDGAAKIVYEEYLPDIDKIQVISERADGNFEPSSYVKKHDPQWRLPIWSAENTKAILPSIQLAKEYLAAYV